METKLHTLTITIYDRDEVYQQVGSLLHDYADKILLRTGYPIKERNLAIIFLIVEMTNDELGALSGKLGQIKNVKVSATTIKTQGTK
ncbi:MAG: iron-only hydrogenase system regulator [Ignavibacteriaceae bacterium]|nr:iron-only hydrogenase system regulator [Ignavibacteriaceae bacterium]